MKTKLEYNKKANYDWPERSAEKNWDWEEGGGFVPSWSCQAPGALVQLTPVSLEPLALVALSKETCA